jgi:hypothetical protein
MASKPFSEGKQGTRLYKTQIGPLFSEKNNDRLIAGENRTELWRRLLPATPAGAAHISSYSGVLIPSPGRRRRLRSVRNPWRHSI